jgi:amicyanin
MGTQMLGIRVRRAVVAALLVSLAFASLFGVTAGHAQEATPAGDPCQDIAAAATPAMEHGAHDEAAHADATPAAALPFDLLFIDQMIPHHAAAVAMAEVALVHAEHAEIRQLSEDIIRSQSAEIAQMGEWRGRWYPGAPAVPMDQMMAQMQQLIEEVPDVPAMSAAVMHMTMDPAAEIATLCLAPPPFDLAFIEGMIPHHESAIAMATVALEQAEHPELQELAEAIIDAQRREIDQMLAWRADWYGVGTPAAAVDIEHFAFDPPTLRVAAGTTVTWTNRDAIPHTMTAHDGGFDSGELAKGQSYSHRFDVPGTYAYHCHPHPNMTGTIVVK